VGVVGGGGGGGCCVVVVVGGTVSSGTATVADVVVVVVLATVVDVARVVVVVEAVAVVDVVGPVLVVVRTTVVVSLGPPFPDSDAETAAPEKATANEPVLAPSFVGAKRTALLHDVTGWPPVQFVSDRTNSPLTVTVLTVTGDGELNVKIWVGLRSPTTTVPNPNLAGVRVGPVCATAGGPAMTTTTATAAAASQCRPCRFPAALWPAIPAPVAPLDVRP
jgi:hypothetical protein